jgi:hypothetical protein
VLTYRTTCCGVNNLSIQQLHIQNCLQYVMASNNKPFSTDLEEHSRIVVKAQACYRGYHIRRIMKEERDAQLLLKPIPGITTKIKAWARSWDARQAVIDAEKMFQKYIKAETEDLEPAQSEMVTRHMQAVLRGAYVSHTFKQYMCALGTSTKVQRVADEYRKQVAADRASVTKLTEELAALKARREALEAELQEERGKVAALELGIGCKPRRFKSEANHNLLRLVGGR